VLVALYQVDRQHIEEAAEAPIELFLFVEFERVLVEHMLLDEVQNPLPHDAKRAHRFVQRDIPQITPLADLLVPRRDLMLLSRSQPVPEILQQVAPELPQFGIQVRRVMT